MQEWFCDSSEVHTNVEGRQCYSNLHSIGLALSVVACVTIFGCIRAPGTARVTLNFIYDEK